MRPFSMHWDKYLAEVKSWDWQGIAEKAEQVATYDGDVDCRVGRVYIGTVRGLMPSGKYYSMLYAENTEPCRHCDGSGHVRNLNANPEVHDKVKDEVRSIRMKAIEDYGYYFQGDWPEEILLELEKLDGITHATGPTLTCPFCDGSGSEEIMKDEVMSMVMEFVANTHGGYIVSGDGGDPCDLFFEKLFDTK